MSGILRRGLLGLLWSVVVPAMAYAQASITGVVRDSSGAVLPGVSVEASSPALIEGTKSVVTDATGLHYDWGLRPALRLGHGGLHYYGCSAGLQACYAFADFNAASTRGALNGTRRRRTPVAS